MQTNNTRLAIMIQAFSFRMSVDTHKELTPSGQHKRCPKFKFSYTFIFWYRSVTFMNKVIFQSTTELYQLTPYIW